jgi:hypothetical protein
LPAERGKTGNTGTTGGAGGARPVSTAGFVRRGLETVRRRSPGRFAEIAGCLERAPVRYAVGAERFTVRAAAERVSVRAGWAGPPSARIETSPHAVLALVDGSATLEELLASEALVVRAVADVLLDLSTAATLFAAEASASPILARHFEEYRAWVAAGR